VRQRLAGGGWAVCALDTELLGHWWPEGVFWLAEALDACEAAGIAVVPLDGADAGAEAVALERPLPVTTWGQPRTLETWSGPRAAGLAWRQRAAELRALAAADGAGERALRELLALQSSDWAFLAANGTAGPYPLERAAAHERELDAALAGDAADERLRGLAPWLRPGAFRGL
jgi:1,4-alpha-glucan branching enzyme